MSKNDFLIEDGVLVEYLGSDDDVIIPKGVKCIGENAFEGSDLRSVVIPEGVVKIESCAFYMCDSLRLVKFPGSIKKVDPSAFGDCYYLSEIHVLGHGDWFKKNTFRGISLEIIVAPDMLCSVWNGFNLLHPAAVGYLKNMDAYTDDRIIDEYQSYIVEKKRKMLPVILEEDLAGGLEIFDDAGEITKKTVDSKYLDPAKEWKSERCIAFLTDWKKAHFSEAELEKQSACNKKKDPYNVTDMKKLWSYEKQEDDTFAITGYKGKSTEIEVPERIGKTAVTTIAEKAFSTYKKGRTRTQALILGKITGISIPDSITRIGDDAFKGCCNLQTINIPEGVQEIGEGAFYGCENLQSIHLPERLKKIGDSTFYNCKKLQTIDIPDSVTEIDFAAFYECESLQMIDIPEKVTVIGRRAFYNCSRLQSISIPAGVSLIGEYTFWGCDDLRTVTISEGVSSIGMYAFCGCNNLHSVIIPGSVNEVNSYAFAYCNELKSVKISEGVKVINYGAFRGNCNLQSAMISGSVAIISANVFENCDNLTITAPEGSHAESYAKENNIPFQAE